MVFEKENVNKKYKLVGNHIVHVPNHGPVDLSKLSLKEADYYHAQKVKGIQLIAPAIVEEPKPTKK